MTVLDCRIVNDTLSAWIERKISELPSFEEQLIQALGKALALDTKPYVPYEQGYLEESAEQVWFIEPSLHNWRLEIVWTGMLNPSREGHEDFIGEDGENLDYALFQYFAPLRHPIKGTDHWVDYGTKDFMDKEIPKLGDRYLEWLFK